MSSASTDEESQRLHAEKERHQCEAEEI